MNTAAKGRRGEHRSRKVLEAAGYEVIRAAGSKGTFDLVGVSSTDMVLVQCKSNRPPGPVEMENLRAFPCPPNCRRLVHVWRDHARTPVVREIP